MHFFFALGLLIVCGIVDATFYSPRSQTFNQLMERRPRSIPIPYSYGYHYNPIEPSINVLDNLSEGLDSRINTFKPIYQNVKMSTHDVNSVPRTHSYQPKNSLYDSEYISVQDIPSLFPEEDSYDYKYLGSPLNKYLTRPPTTESDIAINLIAIKKTSVFGYGFPTYKSPYSSDSVWNFGSKIPNTIFEDSQSLESDPETFKVSSPNVKIVKLLPETLKQEPSITTINPYEFLFEKILREAQNKVKSSVNDEVTQETPTEAELFPINSEESQTVDKSNILQVLEEDPTKDESSLITTEETLTEDKSNSITTEETQTEDESNFLEFKDDLTKNESSFVTTEENLTEDESNSITTEETQTEDESSSLDFKDNPTKNKSSYMTTEENLTEDESNSITTEETRAENEDNLVYEIITSDDGPYSSIAENKSKYITTNENQTEDDELRSTTSQDTTTDFEPNYAFDINSFSESDQLRLKIVMEAYDKFLKLNIKSQLSTLDNIPARSQSNLLSDENSNQKLEPQLANGADMYEEY